MKALKDSLIILTLIFGFAGCSAIPPHTTSDYVIYVRSVGVELYHVAVVRFSHRADVPEHLQALGGQSEALARETMEKHEIHIKEIRFLRTSTPQNGWYWFYFIAGKEVDRWLSMDRHDQSQAFSNGAYRLVLEGKLPPPK